MRLDRQLTAVTLFLLLCGAASFAQQAVPLPAESAGTISLDVVVTTQSGPPVPGLLQQDFVVLDNKVARPITSFSAHAGPQAPVEVILVVDAVNARYDTVAYERERIEKFLLADGGELTHPLTLAVLTDKGTEIQQGSSRDGKALKEALDHYAIGLRTIGRSTGFYGAEDRLDLSLKALDGLIAREETKPGRKMILWVSPGWPLLSGPGVQLDNKEQQRLFGQVVALSTRLRKARITLYNINPVGTGESLIRADYYKSFLKGVAKPGQVDLGDLGLQVLATQTGGLALTSDNDIAAMLQRAMRDANAYYQISFAAAPGEHFGEYHKLDVQVDKPGLIARTRSGYYAEPSGAAQVFDK
jgi:VWFA-related protein